MKLSTGNKIIAQLTNLSKVRRFVENSYKDKQQGETMRRSPNRLKNQWELARDDVYQLMEELEYKRGSMQPIISSVKNLL